MRASRQRMPAALELAGKPSSRQPSSLEIAHERRHGRALRRTIGTAALLLVGLAASIAWVVMLAYGASSLVAGLLD